MRFEKIVETVGDIKGKLEGLSDEKLELVESVIVEGADISFDAAHHMDYIVHFAESFSDENAKVITESVDGSEVLEKILESVRNNPSDMDEFVSEAVELVGEIDVEMLNESTDSDEVETGSVSLLSVVTNTLTEMYGEEVVEDLPAEMVFDIADETKDIDLVENANELNLVDLVEEISTKLESAIKEGEIDLDTDDYDSETLAEFLDDYEDTEDLFEEMEQVTDAVLSESEDKDAAALMKKAKDATVMIEAAICGTNKCKDEKMKAAKKYYQKHKMPGSDSDVDNINPTGKLAKYVKDATASVKKSGKTLKPDYVQYVLIPGIIKRMRKKGKKL